MTLRYQRLIWLQRTCAEHRMQWSQKKKAVSECDGRNVGIEVVVMGILIHCWMQILCRAHRQGPSVLNVCVHMRTWIHVLYGLDDVQQASLNRSGFSMCVAI